MATESSESQVQTGTAPDPATASPAPVSAATETISPSQFEAEVDSDFDALYNPPDSQSDVAPVEDEGKPEEQAQTPPNPKDTETPQAQAATDPNPDADLDDDDKPDQARVRLKGDDALIARIAKQKGISIADAADLFRGVPKAPTIPGTEAAPAPSPVDTLQGEVSQITTRQGEINARMATLKESGDRFTDEYQDLADEKSELAVKYADKNSDLKDAQRQVEQQARAANQTHEQIVAAQNASADEARKAYPSITDKKSALFTVAQAVRAEWMASGDTEQLSKPDAPKLLAEAAVQRLVEINEAQGIPAAQTLAKIKPAAPATPPAPAPLPFPKASAGAPARSFVAPASGNKSTVNGGQPSTLGEAVAGANDEAQIDELLDQIYGKESKETYSLGR